MAALQSLGLRLADPVTELWRKMGEALPQEAHKSACADIAEEMRDGWGCINIACLSNPAFSYEDVVTLIESKGGLPTWCKTIQFLIGHTFLSETAPKGVPPSAALVPQTVPQTKYGRCASGSEVGSADRVARARQERIVSVEEDIPSAFPQGKILDAISETPNYRNDTLTYNDTKAVMREYWLWEATQKCNVASNKEAARAYAQQLYDMHLTPWGKTGWARKMFNRKRNGRRPNAPVTPPTYTQCHQPTRSLSHPLPFDP